MATKKKTETKEFTMTPVFALWKKEGKKGTSYFSGKTEEGVFLKGFFNTNKKNPKEPDLRVYAEIDGKLGEEPIISMWCNVSKNGKKYLTGKLEEKRVVGFINDKAEGNRPYVSVYYSEDKQEKINVDEPKQEAPKTNGNPF